MSDARDVAYRRALAALRRSGLLLQIDAQLPSVATIVAGGPIAGSWWAHAAAHDIYAVGERLHGRDDVVSSKLVAGKLTFVHRPLWPALVAVGSSRAAWQLRGLSPAAVTLLGGVRRAGLLRTDALPPARSKRDSAGALAREFERRLLVFSEEIHTDGGHHAKVIESWRHWARRHDVAPCGLAEAKLSLEDAAARLAARCQAHARLPWEPR